GTMQSPLLFAADKPIVLAPHVESIPGLPDGPFVRLGDGSILGVSGKNAIVTRDDGKTWEQRPIFKKDAPFLIRPEHALLRTRTGTLILIFINDAVRKYSWDKKKNVPNPDMLLPSYAIRSVDEGRTWTDLSLLHGGWCGCIQDIIETRDGNIVVPGQEMLYDKGRHATMPYVSTDQGKTWARTRYLDIGGRGDHAGAIEGTLEELQDGRLWLLLRSYHGFFYESFSSDQGLTWSDQKPSKIKSIGAPGKLKRLASGRLVLLWNAMPRRGFVQREELSFSFSDDDGAHWSPSQVIACNKGGRVSYPHLFEHAPGELWITTMQGDLRVRLLEKDFIKPWVTFVAFGDSTTASRGKLAVYADLLQRDLPQQGVYASVINAGVANSTTDHARKRFQHDVLAHNPNLVVIQFGINDAAVDVWKTPPAQKSRVALARYKENLIYFIDTLRQRKVKVVLMTPNPTRWTPKLRQLYGKSPYDPAKPDGFNIILKNYADAVRQVAKQKQVDLVDIYKLYEAYDQQTNHSMDELLLDGMHPNQKGQRLIAARLAAEIAGRTQGPQDLLRLLQEVEDAP
ncbi:MAG: exo-alpha-sialidase, partial [Planctomycetaceae bacterium]|nr:exo-alpha-sialidase [Planctomycetaceae bacterium]